MLPAEFTDLIALAANRNLPDELQEQREHAARVLLERLRVLARRVAGDNPHLIDELVSHVNVQCLRGLYRARPDASFETWCVTVMRHYRTDIRRRWLRERSESVRVAVVPQPRDETRSRDMQIDLTTPFSPEDDRRVRAWSLGQRVILLPWWLLWRKADDECWQKTVRAAKLHTPFPVRGFDRLPDVDRTAYLAEALGVTPNAINQALGRGREKVFALRFIREQAGCA
jgi:hypothetical protein